ncbi:GATA transcription factor 26-like isoform X2 [Ananas comosus]|uniref:GATA transcription factor 26-like isoform X2 n=1 Tax=Ananas comosus TaxID=4615 RepID=A0A6P5ELE6_ANACO|nr:GATA transcription factor 26-like isoform X2 [Ananas comosus]
MFFLSENFGRGKERKGNKEMGKQGPCRHCGITSTPLWRNGPPDKPVLCNACGSRWRTKGSLANYTPLHAREGIIDSEELKLTKVKSVSLKPKEPKLPKKKQSYSVVGNEREMPFSDQNFQKKIVEGDTSNRSSSGSAISCSESCAQFRMVDASDLAGSAQSNVWDSIVPSKKRTYVTRAKPAIEKLTKDLYSIMHQQPSSAFSVSSEEDLLYSSESPMGSFEMGYGSVLIKHLSSKSPEEESEASSFPVDNRSTADAAADGKYKKCTEKAAQDDAERHKLQNEKTAILGDPYSPLTSIVLEEKNCAGTGGKNVLSAPKFSASSNLATHKRPRDCENQACSEIKCSTRSPKRSHQSGSTNLPSDCSSDPNCIVAASKLIDDAADFLESHGACFSPRSIFSSPLSDRSSILVDDLLVDFPSNTSYPEAQLLYPSLEKKPVSESSQPETGVTNREGSDSIDRSSSFRSMLSRLL